MALHPYIEKILAARGIGPADYEAFFDPSLKRLIEPSAMPGVAEAVSVMLPFVRARRPIVVFGDYDCDGVCATAILVKALRALGADVGAFIPNRFDEGYGMTAASLERLARDFPAAALVVTVDNGVNAVAEIAQLKARGVSVVVTDHHLPGPELPVADALVNPRVAAAHGCAELCGAGVAFFLANALMRAAAEQGLYDGPKIGGPLLVLAGLATVADLMPLVGQNRILVAQALKNFRICAPWGLRELLDHAARRAQDLVARDFGFLLAPRINAAGRMESAMAAYDLVMALDREEARARAVTVDGINGTRKAREKGIYDAARGQVKDFQGLEAVVVADAPEAPWHVGVAGIVAARLMEDAKVPVAVVVGDHGSARAPEGYNVRDALAAVEDTLTRFGGHAAAGGFSVKPGCLARFRELFAAACAAQRQTNQAIIAQTLAPEPDLWLEPVDLARTADTDAAMRLFEALQEMEPFGEGNPEPVFGLRGVSFAEINLIGAEGKHASFAFTNRLLPRAVWWQHGADVESLRAQATARFDVLFNLFTSAYGGDELHVELRLVDVRRHAV